jgi:nitroreductase
VKRIVATPWAAYLPRSMLNDRSSILSLLQTRRSGKPRELVGRGPTDAELRQILTIGARTPDHGQLVPWRFVNVGVDQRDALEEVLQQALAEDGPDTPPAKRQKEHDFAHYEGALIVLVSAPTEDHKIPVWEQELSCGAAAMNLLLAAHALGYVGGWVTGWRAYAETVRRAFCGPGERIAGFIFIGHPGRELDERPRPDLSTVSQDWSPPPVNSVKD